MAEKSAGSGLASVEKYYRDYAYQARELKSQGKKLIGYLCAYIPLEIITTTGSAKIGQK